MRLVVEHVPGLVAISVGGHMAAKVVSLESEEKTAALAARISELENIPSPAALKHLAGEIGFGSRCLQIVVDTGSGPELVVCEGQDDDEIPVINTRTFHDSLRNPFYGVEKPGEAA